MFSEKCLRQAAVFAGGILFGTAGLKILASSDAKKCYIGCLAAGLRAKDSVMTTASAIQENAEDILEEAKEVNRKRAEKEVFEDESEEDADEETDEV